MTSQPESLEQLIDVLCELKHHGALGGIEAIITERVRQVRGDLIDPGRLVPAAGSLLTSYAQDGIPGRLAWAAALLAAEIDRASGNDQP